MKEYYYYIFRLKLDTRGSCLAVSLSLKLLNSDLEQRTENLYLVFYFLLFYSFSISSFLYFLSNYTVVGSEKEFSSEYLRAYNL